MGGKHYTCLEQKPSSKFSINWGSWREGMRQCCKLPFVLPSNTNTDCTCVQQCTRTHCLCKSHGNMSPDVSEKRGIVWGRNESGVVGNVILKRMSGAPRAIQSHVQLSCEILQGRRFPRHSESSSQDCTTLTGKILVYVCDQDFPQCNSCPLPHDFLLSTSEKSLDQWFL